MKIHSLQKANEDDFDRRLKFCELMRNQSIKNNFFYAAPGFLINVDLKTIILPILVECKYADFWRDTHSTYFIKIDEQFIFWSLWQYVNICIINNVHGISFQ